MICGGCGRTFGFRTNQRAGRCSNDRIYECYHCTTLRRKCVFCGQGVSDPAGFLLLGAVFMLVLTGPLLGGLFFPEAITNSHLNSTPVTPLGDLRPGETVKVFATVAANETEVIHGYWGYTSNGGKTWLWTAKNFWITEGSVSTFVEVSSLLYVSQPGNPWGSENGVSNYTAGSPIAIYGGTVLTSNGTTIDAQYVAVSPTSMGHPGGYLWPIAAGAIGVAGGASLIGFFTVRYQRTQHEKAIRSRPPKIPSPHAKPTEAKGSVTRYVNVRLSSMIRRSWITTAITGVLLALAVPLYFANYVLGIFLASMGGVFFAMSFFNRYSYGKSPTVIVTDDQGLSIEPLSSPRYVDDRYVPWSEVANFYVYFGQTLALRTDRGELILPYLSKDLVAQIGSEMQSRGIRADERSTFHPLVGPTERLVPLRPLAASEWQERNRLSGTRLGYSLIVRTTSIVGVVLIVSSIFFSAVNAAQGGLVLAIGFAAMGVSLYFTFRLRAMMKRPTPGDEATVLGPPPGPTLPPPGFPAPSPAAAQAQTVVGLPARQLPPVIPTDEQPASFPRLTTYPAPSSPPPIEVEVAPVPDYWSARPIDMPNVFPKGLLLPGERVLYEVRPDYWRIYGPVTALVGILMLVFLAPISQPGYLLNPFLYVFEGLLAFAIVLLRRSWKGLAFALTSQRVLTVNGRRGTQGREGPLWALQRIGLEGLSGSVITFYFEPGVLGTRTAWAKRVRWPGIRGSPGVYAYVQHLVASNVGNRPLSPPPAQSGPSPSGAERFCPLCGQENSRGSAFCVKCGKALPPPP
jgi:hypothetical protein